jgi:hypothetical protein
MKTSWVWRSTTKPWLPWELLFITEEINVVLKQFCLTSVAHIWGLPTILLQKNDNLQLFKTYKQN